MTISELLKKEVKHAPPTDEKEAVDAIAPPAMPAAKPKPVKYPDKPEGLSDEEYDHLLKYQRPEQISAAFNYRPGQSFLDIYTSSAKKPEEVDKKKIERAKLYGGIADSIGLIAQMFAAGQGAHVKERGADQLATSQINKRANQLRDIYNRELDSYNRGYQYAAFKDLALSLQRSDAEKKETFELLENRRKADAQTQALEERKQASEAKAALDKDKFEFDKAYKNAVLEESKRKNKALESMRIANKRASSSSAAKAENLLYVPAKAGEENAIDVGGIQMIRVPATKGQIEDLASQAKLDKEFINSDYYKLAVRNETDESENIFGLPGQAKAGNSRFANNRQLAAYYVQYLREKEDTEKESPQMEPPLFPFNAMNVDLSNLGNTRGSDPWDEYAIQ